MHSSIPPPTPPTRTRTLDWATSCASLASSFADSVALLALRYSSMAARGLLLSSRWLAYLDSKPAICGKSCSSASSTARSHWFNSTQQSIAALMSPALSSASTACSVMPTWSRAT